MIARVFEHRSGRIIALCRAVLAAVFFLALWIDPAQPVRSAETGYLLLGSYAALAAALFAVAFRSWWWDHRLAWPSLVLDVAAFLAAVYFTEGAYDDFTSPFLAFFAYLMLAATIRWDWRITAWTGLVVTMLYLSVGLGLASVEIDFDQLRFGRRVVYMLVLSLVLIWFGLQRREQNVGRIANLGGDHADLLPPLDAALQYAANEMNAGTGAIAWCEDEEPGMILRRFGASPTGADTMSAPAPEHAAFGSNVRLVSSSRRRALRLDGPGRPAAIASPLDEPLADALGFADTLIIPFGVAGGRGEVLLTDISGVCVDHVRIGALAAHEIEGALNQHASLQLARETALARARDALARDLHDSVAQSLAGAAMRVEGLRNWIRAGNDPEPEIASLKEALREEQRQVRSMIARLREPLPQTFPADPGTSLTTVAKRLAESWKVQIDCQDAIGDAEFGRDLDHALAQMLREAVANSVRHGNATRLAVRLSAGQHGLAMIIEDNGTGFGEDAGDEAPRSIRERIVRLGGTLAVASGRRGTVLTINLPYGASA